MNRLLLTLFLSLSTSVAASADVLDVGGPSPDATSIGGAIAMAADGDVIRVYPGQYPGFTVDGKSLSIVPSAPGVRPETTSGVVIRNLAPGQSVEFASFDIRSTAPISGLSITSCMGAVRVHDLEVVMTGFQSFSPPPAARIASCADVVVNSSSFEGMMGYDPIFDSEGDGGDGGTGIEIVTSTVALYRCASTGGGGGHGVFCCFVPHFGGDGGDAIELIGSGDLFMAQCILEGGARGWDDFIITFGYGLEGKGLRTAGPGFPIQHRECSISSTSGSGSTNIFGTQPRLGVPNLFQDNEGLPIVVKGTPGARVGLYFANSYAHQVILGDGPLLVDVPSGFNAGVWRYLGTIDNTGTLAIDLPLRDLPPLTHVKLHLVAATVDGPTRHYTNSATALYLDSGF